MLILIDIFGTSPRIEIVFNMLFCLRGLSCLQLILMNASVKLALATMHFTLRLYGN